MRPPESVMCIGRERVERPARLVGERGEHRRSEIGAGRRQLGEAVSPDAGQPHELAHGVSAERRERRLGRGLRGRR